MKGRKARLHSDTGFLQEAFKTQSGSARALMPFAGLNGTGSSGCADSTGTPDTKGKWIYLMEKNVPIAEAVAFFRAYVDELASLFDIEALPN
ncbi:hypothetical protein ACFO4L_13550 [Bacillus daqingensis]|uniref:Uncharacterized protein n=1 Tax=Bacillus daqingensis TaxID=872396 RepID=A0ABV9NW69_9BACI